MIKMLLPSALFFCSCVFASMSRADINYQKCILNMSDYDDPHKILYSAGHGFKGIEKEGIVGVIHRCTLGIDEIDSDFDECKKAAQQENLLWGAYHFGKQGEDPVKQADFFVDKLLKSHTSSGKDVVLMVLDEEYFHPKTGGIRFMSPVDAAKFVKRVYDRTGVYPGLYTGRDFLKEQLNRDRMDNQEATWAVLKHCWLWVAKYALQPPEADPWSEWSVWQYTGDGLGAHVSYLPESVPSLGLKQAELNIFSGSAEDAKDFWQDHVWDYSPKNSSR